MTGIYNKTLTVRSYELKSDGGVGHAVFLQWFQEAAFEASASRGFGMKEYNEMGAAWVMRGVDVEFLESARYLEEIEISTWVSDLHRVRSHREYEARRAIDRFLLARARVDWVFLDATTLALRRVPTEMGKLFEPNGRPALVPITWPDLTAGKPLGHFENTRRVQQYELDQMQHVNNSVYVNWIEQHAQDAWGAWGQDAAKLTLVRHNIEYRQAALRNDSLLLLSDATRIDERIIWRNRILRGETPLVEAWSLST
ncbi:MAG TPA: acyl-CoA thioesterase [Anaerolineae bacterium]